MNPPRPHLFGLLAGLFLSAGLVFAAVVFTQTWTRISESESIHVTGSARKNVRSDLVIWRARFAVDAPALLEAQHLLAGHRAKVAAFLAANGIEQFATMPLVVEELTARRQEDDDTTVNVRVGYRLTQPIEVRSGEVGRVPQLAGRTGGLLEQGVALLSEDFDFIYTKAGEAKVEMMAEATKDARARAEQIARQGRRALEGLRSARMGVVQINPLHSSETSWSGNSDTSSPEKTIIATVSATFALR
jgi:hypothetical protein